MSDSYVNPKTQEDFFDAHPDYHNPSLARSKMRQLSTTLNIGSISALAYVALLALKLDGVLLEAFLWLYVSIPLIISLAFLTCYAIVFINADYWRILNPGKKFIKAVTIITLICFVSFIVLLSLKNDGIIQITYGIAFVPLFVLLALALGGYIFLCPGLVDREFEYFWEAILSAIDLLLFCVFIVTLGLKLDGILEWDLSQVFSFVFAMCFIHAIALVYEVNNKGCKKASYSAFYLLAGFLFALMLVLKSQEIMLTSWFVILAPVFLVLIVLEFKAASMMLFTENVKSY